MRKRESYRKRDPVIRKPFKELVFEAEGLPFIYEDDEIKSMHFSASAIQSSMRKNAPFDLELDYTQTMMGFLLLQPAPESILIIGLGGGSLSKYCYRHFPDCQITSVEIDEEVISLRKEFEIPVDDERFTVVHADGANYIAKCKNRADVILLDGYDSNGLPRSLSSKFFYDQCYLALRDNGVLVVNLLKSELQMATYIARLSRAFENKILTVKAKNDDNYIGYAHKLNKMPKGNELMDRALELQARFGIKYSLIASEIRASSGRTKLN
jgi:spermidine synthase